MAGFNLKTRKNKKSCELSATSDKKTWKRITVEHFRFAGKEKNFRFVCLVKI